MEANNLENLIGKAIQREEEAYDFYTGIQNTIGDKEAKEALAFLAAEEKKHREFLVAYKAGKFKTGTLRMSEVIDYKIAEHIDVPDIVKNMSTRDVYLVAAHRELNSYNFYKGLAEIHPDGEAKEMLLRMANEEFRHKEKVEYLYSNTSFAQTEGG